MLVDVKFYIRGINSLLHRDVGCMFRNGFNAREKLEKYAFNLFISGDKRFVSFQSMLNTFICIVVKRSSKALALVLETKTFFEVKY